MSRRYKGRGAVESTAWCVEDAARRLAIFDDGVEKEKKMLFEVVDVGAVPCLGEDGVDEVKV